MADIFLSYAHEDQPAAKRIVDALAREGLEAWWDHEIPPGRSWDEVIGTRIGRAKVVIVIWSAKSVTSNFVKEEAQLAMDAAKLLPVKVADVEPPVGFRRTHAANLADWRGQADHRQWRALLNEIRGRLGGGAATATPHYTPPPPPPPSGPKLAPILIGVGVVVAVGIVGFLLMNREVAPDLPIEGTSTTTDQTSTTDATVEAMTTPTTTATTAQQSAPQTDARTMELQFWRSCCDGSGVNESDYRSYLSRYPRGEFASIAQQRISSLTRPRTVALAGTVWNAVINYETDSACPVRTGRRITTTMNFGSNGVVNIGGEISTMRWQQDGGMFTGSPSDMEGRIDGRFEGDAIVGNYSWRNQYDYCRASFRAVRQ